ncbi:MAG TPA: SagB/ThcOx family dehydrogenase, partial [Anaerolineae bacterium]
MSNRDIQETWHYHHGTKHPGGYLMDYRHQFDPSQRPLLYKIYTDLEPIALPLDTEPRGVPALEAIATNIITADTERIPDIDTVARLLYFSAGVTKRIQYSWGEMYFRAAACTGALYHIELYVVCGDLPGLDAGVYHFEPQINALKRLRQGDYRRVLIEASGSEPAVTHAPAILVYSDVFWRNAVKYQAREYRHAFWDSGTILSHTLVMSSTHDLPAKVVAGFVDEMVNELLSLDTRREVALALVPIGHTLAETAGPAPPVEPLSLPVKPISNYEIDFPAIREMHQASVLKEPEEVIDWRGRSPRPDMPAPEGALHPLQPYSEDEMPQDPIETVIIRRGSTRQYARTSIPFQQLSTILKQALVGVPADFLEPLGADLNHAYLIVNAVDGLPAGAYVYHGDESALELLKLGDFRQQAGYLGLNQDLAADASADIFFMTDLKPILARFGNRGYRAAQLDASISAGRVYLAAYAQRLGASGLTFFDDAVTSFFSPHAHGKSVMFMMTLGKKQT